MSLFENIKSIYLRKLPFEFLKENFLYKLINYSIKTQNIFGLKLYDYKQQFFNQFYIDDSKYLSLLDIKDNGDCYPSDYNINSLKNNLEKDIQLYNLNIESFQNYVINCNKKYIEKKKINDKNKISLDDILIDIFSPFIELFSKDDSYQKLFTIPIVIKFIKEKNLKKEYYNFFDNVNKSKLIYNSFKFILNDFNDIYDIKDLGINFMQIKRLGIKIISEDRLDSPENFKENDLFNIFNLNNIENNLTHLLIDAKLNIKSDIFETINNFKFLNYLKIKNIKFDNVFTVKLNFLNYESCENISISQECANNIKSLTLFDNNINSENKLKFPEIETFKSQIFTDYLLLNETIDLNSMIKLKCLFIDYDISFLQLNNYNKLQIEKLTLFSISRDVKYIIKALKKVFELKKLKKFCFGVIDIYNEELSNLIGQNDSIEKLEFIGILDRIENRMLYNYQSKFPNAKILKLRCEGHRKKEGSLEIKENKNLKINKIKITAKGNNGIYIQSYETLTDVDLCFNIYNHKENGFALFNDKCDYIFNSLINLNLEFISEIEFRIINNIFKNIDKIPNLKDFRLYFVCKDMNEKCYEEYIKKLLSLKLKSIELTKGKSKKSKTNEDLDNSKESEEEEESEKIEDNNLYYSESELKLLNNDFSLMKYYKILITKFN